jgi:hypothetical protein
MLKIELQVKIKNRLKKEERCEKKDKEDGKFEILHRCKYKGLGMIWVKYYAYLNKM